LKDRMDLEKQDGVADFLNECEKIVHSSEKMILFGSAKCAEKVYLFILGLGLWDNVHYVLDNDVMKCGQSFHGKAIYLPDQMISSINDYVIVIASGSAHIIKKQLESMGISQEKLYEFPFTNLQFSPTPFEQIMEKEDEFQETYSLLEDEKSRNVYESLLNYKISRNIEWLRDISDDEGDQYFDREIIKLSDVETFVDCGAYVGDTLQEFCIRTGNRYKKYICFEADEDVCDVLRKNVRSWNLDNIDIHNTGCWDKKDKLRLNIQGSGTSFITGEETGKIICADSLDNMLLEIPITFVKMDIEGAEENALRGMRNVIKKYKPTLAVSIYHSVKDFWYLPQLIKKIFPEYKLYIRHYRRLSDSETVCYAIPPPRQSSETR